MNQKKYTIYIKQLIDGMPSPIFSAGTFPPAARIEEEFKDRYEKILQVSRERYCKKRSLVEEKIQKSMDDIERREVEWEQKKEEFKKQKDELKKKKHEEKMRQQEIEAEKRKKEQEG